MADSRSYQHEIARMREDAHDLLQALYTEQFPDDDAVGALRARIEQSATEVIRAADDPVTLGIVGEFSVGKSLLLGTLLGRPDLLPVEDRATTGNVTALHLRPGNDGERTRFDGDPEIHYLTAEELAKCVRTIMDHLVHHYTGVLHRDLPELDGYDPVTQGWDRLVAVCRRLWGPETSGNPIILDTARELLRIRAAHLSGGGLLGEVVAIPDTRVRQAAIELGTDGGGLASYPDFPVRTITKSAVKGDDGALRISFPLIRRVAYKVTVDAGLWPLDSLRGSDDEVVLLDFPGLTASRSARRDEYLSSTELRDVHTIITVFSMQKPDTKTPLEFRSMLQQHGRERAELDQSILAVGNRFDMIDVPATLAAGQPTAEMLLDHAGLVGRFADTARRLVGRQDQAAAGQWDQRDSADSQITIVSAVAGISHYAYPVSFPAEEQERLDASLREVPASMASWGDVGARLAAAQPGSRWARVLTDFGKDGGISALRQLIEDHAARNGLVNKFKVVERADRRLREQLPQLERLLAPEHAGAGETERAQELLAQVFDDFRRLYGEIDAAAREFGDPTRVTLADGAPLIGGIRNRAVTEVFTWPYWQQFLQRAEHGYVAKGTRRARVRFRGTADQDETTRTFLDQYRDTLQRTARWGRIQLAESVRAWADHHNGKGADLRDRLADEDVRRYLDMGLSRLRAVKDADYEDALQALADLNVLLEIEGDGEPGILASARDMADADGSPPLGLDESTASYPLFIGADGAGSAAMPWHPDVPERPGEADQLLVRHQVYVFRLRRQLAMGAADAVTRQLSAEIDQIYQYLRAVLGEISSLIPGSMQLGQMFPESSGAPGQGDADSEPPDPSEPSEPPPPPVSPVRDLLREWARRQHGA
jgi:hypothetical protein